MPRSLKMSHKIAVASLLFALGGCGRTTVVGPTETTSLAEESPSKAKVVRAQSEESDTTPFAFSDDAGGQLLAKILPPKDVEAVLRSPSASPRRLVEIPIDPPSLPLPSGTADLPRSRASNQRVAFRPRLVTEESLDLPTDAPRLPPAPPLPDNGRIRVPSPDVNRPIPLPILARPVADRASLDDPTLAASNASALAASIPPRSHKAPFLKHSLPDPYDRRRTSAPADLKE